MLSVKTLRPLTLYIRKVRRLHRGPKKNTCKHACIAYPHGIDQSCITQSSEHSFILHEEVGESKSTWSDDFSFSIYTLTIKLKTLQYLQI